MVFLNGFVVVLLCSFNVLFQNYPLYIRSVPTQNELKFHYTVHTSLDVVEEKISAVGKSLGDQRELYLGLLYPTEDYKVYPCVVVFFRLRVKKTHKASAPSARLIFYILLTV